MKRYLLKGQMGKLIHLIIAFCFALLALLGVAEAAFAQEPFIVQPTSIQLGKVQQGDTIQGSLQITNRGEEAIDVEVLVEGRLITGEIGDCITLSPSALDIPPGGSRSVDYQVVISSNADPGEYIFGLIFRGSALELEEGTGVTVGTAVEVPLSFTGSGTKVEFYKIRDVKIGDDFEIRAIIWNYEDSQISTRAVFDLFDEQRTLLQIFESSEEMVQPGKARVIEFSKSTQDMGRGDYLVVGKFYRNGQLFKEIERRFRVGAPIFEVSNLVINPSIARPGEVVTISVDVTNSGDIEGTYTAILEINDTVEETKDVTVASGETETVTFTTSRDEEGTYSVTIAELTATFTVKAAVPWNVLIVIIGVAAVFVVAIVLLVMLRLRGGKRPRSYRHGSPPRGGKRSGSYRNSSPPRGANRSRSYRHSSTLRR